MSEEEKQNGDTETGFGTGLRAQLERKRDPEPAPAAPAGAAPPSLGQNGESNVELETLRGELAAALQRERDLHAALSNQVPVQRGPDPILEQQLASRLAELDARTAKLAAGETELEERERRVAEQLQMIRAEKERLSEIENRVVSSEALATEREQQVQTK